MTSSKPGIRFTPTAHLYLDEPHRRGLTVTLGEWPPCWTLQADTLGRGWGGPEAVDVSGRACLSCDVVTGSLV